MERLVNDCAGSKLVEIANYNNITISNNLSHNYPASTNLNTGDIQWRDEMTELALVEELFHSYQIKQGLVSNYGMPLGNVEIEAKVSVCRYAQRQNIKFTQDKRSWGKIGAYSDNPTPENFPIACEGLANAGYFNFSTDVNKMNLTRANIVSEDC